MLSTNLRAFLGDLRFIRALPESNAGLLARRVVVCSTEAISAVGADFSHSKHSSNVNILFEIIGDSDVNAKTVFFIECIKKISDFVKITGSDGFGCLLIDEQFYMDPCDVAAVNRSVREITIQSDLTYINQTVSEHYTWKSLPKYIGKFPILSACIVGDHAPVSIIKSFSREPILSTIIDGLDRLEIVGELKLRLLAVFGNIFEKESSSYLIGRLLSIHTTTEDNKWELCQTIRGESYAGHSAEDEFKSEIIAHLKFFVELFAKRPDIYIQDLQMTKESDRFVIVERGFEFEEEKLFFDVKTNKISCEDLDPAHFSDLGFLNLSEARAARRPSSAASVLFTTPTSPSMCETSASASTPIPPSPVPYG